MDHLPGGVDLGSDGRVQPEREPQGGWGNLVVRGTYVEDGVDEPDVDGVGVVAGEGFGLRRRRGDGLGRVVPVLVVVMVVTAVPVVMMAVVVVMSVSRRPGVDMRSEIVSGRPAAAVRVAEDG